MTEINTSSNQEFFISHDLLGQFFDLAVSKDISTLLTKALQIVVDTFEAGSGSILYNTRPMKYIKMGTYEGGVLEYINRLEKRIADQLKKGMWRVFDPTMAPVSIKNLSNEEVVVINTPLLCKTQVVGSLSMVISETQPLTESHKQVLINMARGIGQLASTVEKLSLIQKRLEELDLIYKMGQALATTFEIQQLLESVMQLASNVLNAAAASILLADAPAQSLVFVASSPASTGLINKRVNLDSGVASWVYINGQPIIINDVDIDPRFDPAVDQVAGLSTESIAAVPLKLKGQVVGVLEVLNKNLGGSFDASDLRLMTSIAAQAAIALENARLYQILRTERDKIIKAQEDVRKELSRNLHDGTVQRLAAISMNLEYIQKLMEIDMKAAIQEISSVRELVLVAVQEARLVLFELRPLILETQGLIPALKQYVTQLTETENVTIESEFPEEELNIDKKVSGTIFSIVQEAVNNAKRHARGTIIKITVSTKADQLFVHIKDNGDGFDVAKTEEGYVKRRSLGLLNMKERAELIEGILAINSRTEGPMHGTTITLSVPLKPGTAPLSIETGLLEIRNYEQE